VSGCFETLLNTTFCGLLKRPLTCTCCDDSSDKCCVFPDDVVQLSSPVKPVCEVDMPSLDDILLQPAEDLFLYSPTLDHVWLCRYDHNGLFPFRIYFNQFLVLGCSVFMVRCRINLVILVSVTGHATGKPPSYCVIKLNHSHTSVKKLIHNGLHQLMKHIYADLLVCLGGFKNPFLKNCTFSVCFQTNVRRA